MFIFFSIAFSPYIAMIAIQTNRWKNFVSVHDQQVSHIDNISNKGNSLLIANDGKTSKTNHCQCCPNIDRKVVEASEQVDAIVPVIKESF